MKYYLVVTNWLFGGHKLILPLLCVHHLCPFRASIVSHTHTKSQTALGNRSCEQMKASFIQESELAVSHGTNIFFKKKSHLPRSLCVSHVCTSSDCWWLKVNFWWPYSASIQFTTTDVSDELKTCQMLWPASICINNQLIHNKTCWIRLFVIPNGDIVIGAIIRNFLAISTNISWCISAISYKGLPESRCTPACSHIVYRNWFF